MRTGFILLCVCLLNHALKAQPYQSKWQFVPAYGANIPITKLPSKGITDNLIQHQNHTSYAQIVAATWFFKRRWGLSLKHQSMFSSDLSKRDDIFLSETNAEYEQDYFVTPFTTASYQRNGIFGGFERTMIGLIYRFENDRWFLYPEFSFGLTSFYTDWGSALLKKKNSNELLRLSYNRERGPNDFLTLALSSSIGYKLSKRFYVNAGVTTSWYQANLDFEKELLNLNTNLSTTENIDYNKHLFTFSAGAGLIFVIH